MAGPGRTARELTQSPCGFVTASVPAVRKDDTALCLLLLPAVLEELPYAERLKELLRAPSVAAIEPPRWRRRTGDSIAATQARRLTKKLPGTPRVAVVFHPRQYRLGRALIGRHMECELWYGPAESSYAGDEELEELDMLARQRAALVFDPHPKPGEPAFRSNASLWDRLEELNLARR
jgi:hypothetical protein